LSVNRTVCILLAVVTLLADVGCGLVGPSCRDETGEVFTVDAQVPAGGLAAYSVVSPKSSNLLMQLTWPDTAATLALRATITDCGGHTGCSMTTQTPPFGPGGSSPVPQPWPPGLREMVADGWRGKTYRVEVAGDPERDAAFRLRVTYRIDCES
jgi:hypothetical protein